jgi:hypothetical protein
MQLDTIIKDMDEGPLAEDDINDHPGKGSATISQMTRYRSCAGHDNTKPGLMVCPFIGSHLLCG